MTRTARRRPEDNNNSDDGDGGGADDGEERDRDDHTVKRDLAVPRSLLYSMIAVAESSTRNITPVYTANLRS